MISNYIDNENNNNSNDNDFFADSPYFNAFIEREMRALKFHSSTVKDIIEKTKNLVKAGEQMTKKTKKLALSCRLGLTDESTIDEKKELRDKLGRDTTDILNHLSMVLDEVASQQDQLCQFVEESVITTLEEFSKRNIRAHDSYKEAVHETHECDKSLMKYINEGGGKLSATSGHSHTKKSHKPSRKSMHKGGGGHDGGGGGGGGGSNDPALEQATKAAETKIELEKICSRIVSSEIKRFELSKSILECKNEHSRELSKHAAKLFSGFHRYYSNCGNIMTQCGPRLQALGDECARSLFRYHKQTPEWDQREHFLNEALQNIKDATKDTEEELRNIADSQFRCHAQGIGLDTLEKDVQIWELNAKLSEATRYPRAVPEGVLLEGWLYQKSSSLLHSSSSWNKRWFVLRDEGLFYLDEHHHHHHHNSGGKNSSNTGTNSTNTTEKVKFCDLLFTIRTLHGNPGSSGNDNRFCFELVTPKNVAIALKARGPVDYQMWVHGMRSVMENQIGSGNLAMNGAKLNKNCYVGGGRKSKIVRQKSEEIETTILNRKDLLMFGAYQDTSTSTSFNDEQFNFTLNPCDNNKEQSLLFGTKSSNENKLIPDDSPTHGKIGRGLFNNDSDMIETKQSPSKTRSRADGFVESGSPTATTTTATTDFSSVAKDQQQQYQNNDDDEEDEEAGDDFITPAGAFPRDLLKCSVHNVRSTGRGDMLKSIHKTQSIRMDRAKSFRRQRSADEVSWERGDGSGDLPITRAVRRNKSADDTTMNMLASSSHQKHRPERKQRRSSLVKPKSSSTSKPPTISNGSSGDGQPKRTTSNRERRKKSSSNGDQMMGGASSHHKHRKEEGKENNKRDRERDLHRSKPKPMRVEVQ